MELTRKQEEGLKIALQRHRNLENQFFQIDFFIIFCYNIYIK